MMDVAELEEAEFAYVLAMLHASAVIGDDSPGLFPAGRVACDEVYETGLRQLHAHGWLIPLAQAGQYDLSVELRALAAVVAAPELVVFTLAPQPGGHQRRFMHYLAGEGIVELSKTIGVYRLLALPSPAAMFERVADLLGVFGAPAAEAAPAPFIIEEPAFAAIRALAESGAIDEAAAQLAAWGAAGPAGAALAAGLARPDDSATVGVVRIGGDAAVAGGRKAMLYGQRDWVWLVQRLEPVTTRLQVQVARPETLAAVLRQFVEFLRG